jgi:hypothetical protein
MPRKKRQRASPRERKAPQGPRALHYKVVELSNVDESSLERALNEWVPRGWTFEGVQFAMRESSKRPAMGFVFFTRAGAPLVDAEPEPAPAPLRGDDEARASLEALAREPVLNPVTTTVHDAWERLRAFATDDEGAP